MSNTEWKNGYEEGFAAGWKAAKGDNLNYTNFPPVYYGSYNPVVGGNYTVTASAPGSYASSFATMADQPYNVSLSSAYTSDTITVKETKKPDLKVIRNLTDHTRIV